MERHRTLNSTTGRLAPVDSLGLVLGRYLLTGDEGAIEEVVRATRPRLLAVAARIAGPDDAEDAVQTAFLSLVRHRGAPLDAPVLPWLMTAVVRTAYRKRAAARRDQRLADRLAMDPAAAPETSPSAVISCRDDDLPRLRAAVARLPSRYRDPVVLHDLHGLSTVEVARLLDLTEGGVRTRLHRARTLVRARLVPRLVASILVLPLILVERSKDVGVAAALGIGGLVNIPTVAVITVVALAAGILVGQKVLTSDDAVAERVERAENDVKRLSVDVDRLTKERDEARAKASSALAAAPSRPTLTAPARATEPVTSASAMTDGSASAKPDASKRIAVAGYEAMVEAVDWGKVGNSIKELAPLIPKFADDFAKNGKPSLDLAGHIQEFNGALIRAAGVAQARLGVGTDRVNSAYTHPSFVLNAMAAGLEAAGKPLSPEQMKAISDIATRYAADDARRESSYDEKSWAIRKLLEETELKERMFADAFAVLSAEQHDALVDPSIRGRMQLDMFSAGLIWVLKAQVVRFTDANDLTRLVETETMNLLGWDKDKQPIVHGPVAEAVAAIPREQLEETPDPLSKLGLLPLSRVVDAARRQVALLERLIAEARLDDAQARAVGQVSLVMVPLHREAPAAGDAMGPR